MRTHCIGKGVTVGIRDGNISRYMSDVIVKGACHSRTTPEGAGVGSNTV